MRRNPEKATRPTPIPTKRCPTARMGGRVRAFDAEFHVCSAQACTASPRPTPPGNFSKRAGKTTELRPAAPMSAVRS